MGHRFRQFLRVVFGEVRWTPPSWVRALAGPRFWAITSLLLALLGTGYGVRRWLASRPQPEYLAITVDNPAPTALVKDARPEPLRIHFSSAAAPLELVGKEISTNFTVTPPVAGSWSWSSDTEIVFVPAAEWPVGVTYQLDLRPGFLAPQALLETQRIDFHAPPITATVESSEFFEDPTDPKNKRAIATIVFTHPVDKAALEKRVALRLRIDPETRFDGGTARSLGFKLTFDETGAKAYVQSEPISIPDQAGEVRIAVADGVQAARGGVGTSDPFETRVVVPGIDTYFEVVSAQPSVVTNEAHRMDRILSLEFTVPVRPADLQRTVSVWELPANRPALGDAPEEQNHTWTDPAEVVPEVLAAAKRLDVTWLPSVPEFAKEQRVRFEATSGRALYVTVDKGTKAFGDFALSKPFAAVLDVEEFPRTVEIMHDGAVLALSGGRTLSLLLRNLSAIQIELRRLLPGSIAHLASQTRGDFQTPDFRGELDTDDLAEIFHETRALAKVAPGEAQYEAIDFGKFLANGAPPRGLFELAVFGWDPEKKTRIDDVTDRRVVLVTDLGLLVKDAIDGSHDVFVMSLGAGTPVAGAEVQLLGKNGLPVLTRVTDDTGRAQLPATTGLEREKTPVAYVVSKNGDLAFLPTGRRDRRLDLSRYDIGGVDDAAALESLHAVLFSDRGIYRPGEEVTLGVIVKTLDWSPLPDGVPLELAVIDPRGNEIRTEKLTLPQDGFREFRFPTLEATPTGPYQIQLHIVRDDERKGLLGQTTVRVEEFLPDRMTIDAQLSAPTTAGWVAPADLRARVSLKNLFGTAAIGNRVKGTLRLSPIVPSFPKWEAWTFYDPLSARQSYDETLAELRTGDDGAVEFPLGLDRFERATYRLRFIADGFEAEGNRSVSADAGTIVSPLPFLIAWKADGDLDYVKQGSARTVQLVAVGPTLEPVTTTDVTAELIEITFVTTLVKEESGLLNYRSVKKETSRGTQPLPLGTTPATLALPTQQPGQFVYVLHDTAGTELNRVSFEVVGEGNVAGRIDREAELKVRLSRPDWSAGDEIEVSIVAPYPGAGLITIERDKVYAAQWFKADGNATIQHIRLPETLEGNGYVVVSFVRNLGSRDIYLSPLSSGAAPFSISRARRTQRVTLDTPAQALPGTPLHIAYTTTEPSKLAVFAVDEGILQVARWKTPDPLAHFFRKRSLGVKTAQILDLLLPEYEIVRSLSAPGGDQDSLVAGNLNPFKRRGQKPVAYWSGILDVPAGAGSVDYTVPDHFNGTLRVVAVAVNAATIGVSERKTVVRGPFVVQPTLPYFAAPGDEFEATALVANTLDGSGPQANVTVSIAPSDGLEVVGAPEQTIVVPEARDATVRWTVRVTGHPGTAHCGFKARAGEHAGSATLDMSIRPPSPHLTTVATAVAKRGGTSELAVDRALFAERRDVIAAAATSPLGLLPGLARYLSQYPHGCTEQLVSMALPGVLLGARPELNVDPTAAAALFEKARATLQARQNADGAFGLYAPDGDVDPFLTAYATHFLLEARARGQAVPDGMLKRALEYATKQLEETDGDLWALRAKAYAVYLLTRNGQVKTTEARALRDTLVGLDEDEWHGSSAALLLAATFQQLHLDDEARRLLDSVAFDRTVEADYDHYDDATIQRGLALYLLAKHFPSRARTLPAEQILSFAETVTGDQFNTLSAAFTILGLDAWSQVVPAVAPGPVTITSIGSDRATHALPLDGTTVLRAAVPEGTARVRFESPKGTPLFHQLTQSGFDREPPTTRAAHGLEVVRELRGSDGTAITKTSIASKVDVSLLVRSSDDHERDVVVVDLLPGGFEVDLASDALAERRSLTAGDDAWAPSVIDVREDRVVFYGRATATAQRFVYRIKPTNRGHYTVPPVLIEGFYDRGAWGRGLGGELEVGE